MVKPQFELGRERVGRGVVRDAGRPPRGDPRRRRRRAEIGLPVRGFASSGLPGPKGNRETFVWCGGDGPAVADLEARDRSPRCEARRVKTAALITHSHPPAATEAVADRRRGRPRGRLAAGRRPRTSSTSTAPPPRGSSVAGDESAPTSASCSAATARSCTRCAASPAPACRSSASTSAPSASSPRSSASEAEAGDRAAPSPARSRRSSCRGCEVERRAAEAGIGLNDVTLTRRPHDRVAELSYRIAGEEVGHVRCDGLVAATPVGSTGYNLANQGPILAWGVKGYVVSYISPHSLTARALVVAPGDVLHVGNAAGREPVEVAVDGAPVRRARRRARRWRSASSRRSAASPSCPGRASTSGSARSSATWPSRRPASRADGDRRSSPSGCRADGAQVVDPGPRLDRDVHAAARRHGRQRRPAGHPARTAAPASPACSGSSTPTR